MSIPSNWRRDAVCLSIGALVGIAAVFAGRSRSGSHPTVAPPSGLSTAQAPTSPTPVDDGNLDGASHRRRRAKSIRAVSAPPTWEQAAAAYRATDRNPALARSLMLQLPPKALRKLALEVAAWPNLPHTWRVLREVYQHWAEIDPLNALAQAQTLGATFGDQATFAAAQGFAAGEPAQAAAYFAAPVPADARGALRDLSTRRLGLTSALRLWADQDAPAAAAFATGLSATSFSSSALSEIAAEWTQQDPAAAMAWAVRLPDQENWRSSAVKGVIETWTQTDPQAAANYALSFSGDPSPRDLVPELISTWSAQNLPDAARWTLGQTGDVQAKAAEIVVAQWSRNDPAGAAAWAAQLPVGSARNEAYGSVASSWIDFDPAATRDWLTGLPAGDARDAAIVGYSTAWQNNDHPADVLPWVQSIDNPAKRDATMIKVLNGWLEDHPEQAHTWITQANLPPSLLDKLSGG